MNRGLVFIVTIALFFGVTSASGGYVGVSSQCINQQCFVAASTSLISIVAGLVFFAFAISFPRGDRKASENNTGVWRRFGAFFLDFMVVLLALTPITVLPTLIAEYVHTNSYAWTFQRDFSRSTDNWIIIPTVFLMFGGLYYYFYKFCLLSKQTLGQYVSGYRIQSIDGPMNSQKARKRVLLSILGLCLWPISVILGLRNKRVFWWDSSSGTQALTAETVNKNQNEMDGSVEPPI